MGNGEQEYRTSQMKHDSQSQSISRVGQWVGQASKINFLTSIGVGPATTGSYPHFTSSNTGDLPMCPVHCVQVQYFTPTPDRRYVDCLWCFAGQTSASPPSYPASASLMR
ncbi:hypothetical protein HAX54_016433 [Datura stramonium]|uniref:Uncharacterized protein n=1 Tax=Datura stramonium TaxID=4076 RepID=A0ABS8UL31_DATST|nr:hypothetical protein [Datura stramonium]